MAGDGSCDEDKMDVQETTGDEDLDSEQNEDQEMSAEEDSSHHNVTQHKREFRRTALPFTPTRPNSHIGNITDS